MYKSEVFKNRQGIAIKGYDPVWGAFGTGTLNPNKPEGARLIGLPDPTWDGHCYIDNLIMVGTPNAGSIQALDMLVEGFKPAVLIPRYPES